MKIQLIEVFHVGHHANYIEALLPTFRRNLENGQISEVTITVTKTHHEQLLRQGIDSISQAMIHMIETSKISNQLPNLSV